MPRYSPIFKDMAKDCKNKPTDKCWIDGKRTCSSCIGIFLMNPFTRARIKIGNLFNRFSKNRNYLALGNPSTAMTYAGNQLDNRCFFEKEEELLLEALDALALDDAQKELLLKELVESPYLLRHWREVLSLIGVAIEELSDE